MSTIDLMKTSNFIIQFKDQRKLELMVQVAAIPGFTLGEIVMGRPVVSDKRPGDSLTFNDLSLTVLCDEDLIAFREVYASLISAANPMTGDISLASNLVFDATLMLTTNKNNIQHKVRFYNAWFKNVSDLPLETTSMDGNYITFSVDMGYSFYNFE